MIVATPLVLSGCQTGKPGVSNDTYTGVTTYYSGIVDANSGLLMNLKSQAIYSDKLGYGVKTNYFSSASGWMFLESAYAGGRQYNYDVTDRQTAMCSGTGCVTIEKGFIHMTESEFAKAAETGFDFKLIGSRGSVTGRIEPAVFQQVTSQRTG
ncbi:hypothetical protein VQ042_17075 [Aurantimonas sp. A2-1-M11]|uniref:hypothetical protein n=1 Tax=Aurantimonas sp. A2-1-M11 TaxID=3113712 RepID=UPI002F9439AF